MEWETFSQLLASMKKFRGSFNNSSDKEVWAFCKGSYMDLKLLICFVKSFVPNVWWDPESVSGNR